MLRDIRDLLDEEEEEYTSPEDLRRRNLILIGGAVGGALLLILMCFGAYALILAPRLDSRRMTQIADSETQIASINQAATNTPSIVQATTAAPDPTRTATVTPTPKAATTDTPEPSPTVTPTVPTATSTGTPTAVATTTPQAVFEEDFEGSGGAWPSQAGETFEFGITSPGQFRMLITTFFADVYSVRQREFQDVRLEVDVTRGEGPASAYAGVICRFQDSANYYAFVIDGQGGYQVFKKAGGVATDLGESGSSTAILPGQETNRLRADCVGDTLTLHVNGQQFLRVQDDQFPTGKVGLLSGTLDEPDMEVFFDNFIIANP